MSSNDDRAKTDQTFENKVTVSEHRYARINEETIDSSLLGIITARPLFSDAGEVVDFEYLTSNSALKHTHGIAPEDLVGKTMLTVFPELGGHVTFPYYCEVAKTGEPIVFESDFESDELNIHVVVSVSRPRPDMITITFVEVSEIVRITDALAELNALSGTQVDLSTYVQGALEIGRRAFNANRAFQLNLHDQGYSVSLQTGPGEARQISKPLPEAIVLGMREADRVEAVRNLRNHTEDCDVPAGGFPFNSFIGASFLIDEQTVGALAFCFTSIRRREPTPSELKLVRTLTDAVASRIRLEAASIALKQRNEDLERFASLVSHDLKAPLRTIRLLSEMLSGYVVDDEQAKTFITEIQSNADQAQSMIKALREFARLGTAGLRLEAVNIESVVADCVTRLAADIQEVNGSVHVAASGHVLADRTLLLQVFGNLILNAMKYSGGSEVEVRIDSEVQEDGRLAISVADNGQGVDVRYAERIFELFRRVPGSEKQSEGEGVGLAVCRKIVESLGGRIWLDTEFTSGARFCLTLPTAD